MLVKFYNSIYQIMLQHHLGLIESENKKMLKAKAEIEATGKTKLAWDENVKAKDYVWSIDVMAADNHFKKDEVVEAYEYLEANHFVERLKLPSGQLSQCYYIPIQKDLGHDH